MNTKFHLRRKTSAGMLLCACMLSINFAAFSQTPYNVVMNLYQDPATKMAFNWFADYSNGCGKVEIVRGIAPNHAAFAHPFKTVYATCTENNKINKAVVTGLSPNTTYSFRVGGVNDNWSDIGTFTTATAQSNKDPFIFIYTTDPQADNPTNFEIAKTTAYAAFAKFPESKFWMACGDLVETGNQQWQWNDFFSTQQELFLKIPFAPVQGNHEYYWSTTCFRRHFNTENLGKIDTTGSTYTFVYGDAQFFALDSELYDQPAYIDSVKKWMRKQVNDNPNVKWRIVYYHKTIYSGDNYFQGDSSCKIWRNAMAPLFDELNIDIAFQGHSHVYEVIGPVKNKELVQGAVSNLVTVSPPNQNTINVTGKSGGTFNVREGTLYFLNNRSGYLSVPPNFLDSMPGSSVTGVSDYPSLFTGRFGQNGHPTYSHVSVTSGSIVITTYEMVNGNSQLLDEITIMKCAPYTHEKLTYTTNQSISNANYVIADELRIKNNATVTFTNSTVRFYEGAKVIVEPGSTLVIDGGIFTSACDDEKWDGIIVLGTRAKPQTEQYQGTVELKNEATIEHAFTAISAAPTGYYHYDGGIIKATNAIFRNNWRAIEYCSYENTNSNDAIIDNVGKFINCTFTIDDNYRFSRFGHHVTMWEVRGVTFEGCTFKTELSTRTGSGIYSMDAGYKVKNYCPPGAAQDDCPCPEQYANASVFENMAKGIHSNNTGEPYRTYLDQLRFQSLDTAVRIHDQNNYRVTRSEFINIKTGGLRSYNSSGYMVEENLFLQNMAIGAITHGIYMSNSGIAENRIYNNRFDSIDMGIHVYGNNGTNFRRNGTDPNIPHNSISGLQFLRNDFTKDYYDVRVSGSTTIRSYQGSQSSGADNKFINTSYSSIYFVDLRPQQITYYHTSGSNSIYHPINPTSNVTVIDNASPAPNSDNPCDVVYKTEIFSDSLEQYKSMQQQYDEWFAQLKDNPELLQELLVLSDAMRELSDHAISRILGDSILYLENLKPWYEVVRTPVAKYSLAEVYFYEKKYDQAEMVLNKIPDMFEYSESEMTEHNNYMRFYNFKKQLQLADRNWTQLDETEIAYLQTIAEATNGRSASMAQGVLCFFFDICYEDKIEEGDEVIPPTKNMATETQLYDNQNKNLDYELSLYPNPTSSEMTVVLNNPAVKIVAMAVYDIYGKNVSLQTVNQSYSTLKMSELAQGVYILKVWLDQGDVVIRKVVKQ